MTEGSSATGQVRSHVGDVSGCVVVGTDGSACGHHALEFAAREAELHRCPLVVLRAWSLTTAPRPEADDSGVVPPLSVYESAVRQAVLDEVASVLGHEPRCPIDVRPVHASAGDALVEATEEARLTVVGSRGHGTVAGFLLGSVSDHVVRHARGTVAVVH